MRGSAFYMEHRLAARETDKNYLVHLEMLNSIKQRQKSSMRKSVFSLTNCFQVVEAQGLRAVEISRAVETKGGKSSLSKGPRMSTDNGTIKTSFGTR